MIERECKMNELKGWIKLKLVINTTIDYKKLVKMYLELFWFGG